MIFLKTNMELLWEVFGIQLNLYALYVPGGTAGLSIFTHNECSSSYSCWSRKNSNHCPTVNGKLNPLILACAKLLGIDEIYKVGGAQAIAAMAYGTKKIKK